MAENDTIKKASKLLGEAVSLLSNLHVPSVHVSSTPTQSGTNAPRTQSERPTSTSDILTEHRRLFAPMRTINNRRNDSGNHRRQTHRAVKKTVCVLSSKYSSRVPTLQEKTTLLANGLGEKTLFFPSSGSSAEVRSVLLREFPRLEEGGGFEIMRTQENSRVYLMVSCVGACSVNELMQISSGRIFIRPIQKSISLDLSKTTLVSSEFEECFNCGTLINLKDMRDHSKECKKMDSDELPDIFEDPPTLDEKETPSEQPNEADPEGKENTVTTMDVEKILAKLKDIHDPVTVLKEYQKFFLLGRKLDLTSESDILDGEVVSIFVSRERILETGFSELLEPGLNFRVPLDVTFYGEEAQDAGGPRREFFSLVLREILKEEHNLFQEADNDQYVFTENENNMEKQWYYTAGLVCGLSILQGGPLPTFMKNFGNIIEQPTRSQEQFLKGLNQVGLVDVIKAKPCTRFLFQASAKADITLRKLKHLFQPKFDEAGSNQRRRQEKIYEIFLNYLKEVAAGRREVETGKITLGHVLKFVTGSEWEPVLGFCLQPKISFTEAVDGSLIPKSSTCINCLYMPVPGVLDPMPEPSYIFNLLDLAFCNTYFGLN